MKKVAVIVVLFLVFFSAQGQKKQVFIPHEVQQAYKNNTRSFTGKPGENYFQNHSKYTIEADFNPETGLLKGKETIVYTNNSPDDLSLIPLRVYMNIFKKGAERDFGLPSEDLHDGVQINSVSVNGTDVEQSKDMRMDKRDGTVRYLFLKESVKTGEEVKIYLEWTVQLPTNVTIRMGKYENDSWFVGYWYPQISVYDDISGWDTHPFTGSAEFYNDFCDYDVTITVPEEYMVWATGTLQKPEKHYQPGVLERYKQAHNTEEIIPVVTENDIENNKVLKGNNKWQFKAKGVPDFAFAVSKHYIWDATSVEVDQNTGRRTFVNSVYKKSSKSFKKVAEIAKETIDLLSDSVMRVSFPYPEMTVFNGSGGMEYPMIINDGDTPDYINTVHLTAHEIGHNYFPFYVMTNESYYAFMDEGLISFLPRDVEGYLVDNPNFDPFRSITMDFKRRAGNMKEVPLMVKSYMLSDYSSYRLHAYVRPANAFYFLRDMIGHDKFHEIIKIYIDRWKKKHPTPYDFFYTFEDVLGKDLSWYWNPWFFEFGYPDLAIGKVAANKNPVEVEIKKLGNVPIPLHLTIKYEDDSKKVIRKDASIWKNGNSKFTLNLQRNKNIEKIEIGAPKIPDAVEENNFYNFK
jgi:hypothetical protein